MDSELVDPGPVFRAAGHPLTVQRRTIWECLAERSDHPTADDVYVSVAGRLPGVARTTVYRTLETLVQLGLAARVGHPGVAVRYDPRTDRHHHLVCESCGRVADLGGAPLEDLRLPREVEGGFRVRDYSVQLLGLCADCARAERSD